jgi:serine phosphatase RsbU (regulator of sigma subunit)
VSIYLSLLGNLALVIVLLSGAIMALTFIGSQRTVERLSGLILRETTAQIELKLRHFFDPVIQDLDLVRAWDDSGLIDLDDAAALNRLLAPVLRANRQLSAVLLADERGRAHVLFHFGDTWSSRETRADAWDGRAAWLDWTDERPEPVASSKDSDYDPRFRPWYQGAIAVQREARPENAPGRIYWTEPYTFYTAKAPGMTAAMAFRGRDGRVRVVGFDVLLTDISAFTTSLRAGDHGEVVVLTDNNRVIGLPRNPRYRSISDQLKALLKRPDELDAPVVADATRALSNRPSGERGPVRLVSGGEPWWVDMSPFRLGPERELSMVVMVPESDLLGSLGYLRLGIVLVMTVGLALAIFRAARLARRYSRPIEALVRESERISRGDLDRGPAVVSSIREVHRLADAHERMRLSLKTLLKLESDLQVARRIQQDTLPEQIPVVPGFDIDAWNEPAEETGGDTYDVIGYRRVPGEAGPRLSQGEAERAVLLLADATGHGIGPALSVTQVRAMLRMAIRVGEDLPAIVRHLNAQLCADLSDGRFISAWLGELDAKEGTLTGFSCGQGPLLYYRAAEETAEVLETDAVPLGCFEDLEVNVRAPLRMESGDIFVALSDGVIEAENPAGERFGTRRVIDLIARHRKESAPELMATLREALTAFTGPTPADDDRTVVIVKRSS